MQLCKVFDQGSTKLGLIRGGFVIPLDLRRDPKITSLADILAAPEPAKLAMKLANVDETTFPLSSTQVMAPIDRQEVWAAGVTYKRSKTARESESAGAGSFYDKVYTAPRPELFFKATAERVVGPGSPIRIRQDSRWTVPEPELALYICPDLRIVGYGIGNDMSARDIEGENPLYLPQAKLYNGSCAIGPIVTLPEAMPAPEKIEIKLVIERNKMSAFQGTTKLTEMARPLASLVEWLGRDNSFPHGVILLTGTGIVPPDDFALQAGDNVSIEITGVGKLTNPVVQG